MLSSNIPIEQLEAPVVALRDDGTFEAVSPAARALFSHLGLDLDHPEALPADLLRHLRNTPTGEAFEWYPEGNAARCLGGTRYGAGPGRVIVVMRELTAVRRSLARQLYLHRQAATALVASEIAHDCRNALAGIVYHGDAARELVQAVDSAVDQLSEILGEIETGARRLEAIIAALVDRAYPSTGPGAAVSLSGVLGAVGEVLRSRLRDRAIVLTVARAPEATIVVGNRLLIQEALLLATSFVLDDGDVDELAITVTATVADATVAVSFRGALPPGLGLGLPLLRDVVAPIGGEVTLDHDGERGRIALSFRRQPAPEPEP